MRFRLSMALSLFCLGLGGLWLAMGSSAYSKAATKVLPKHGATAQTKRFTQAADKASAAGYLHRKSTGKSKGEVDAKGWVSVSHIDDDKRTGRGDGEFRYELHVGDQTYALKLREPATTPSGKADPELAIAPNSIVTLKGTQPAPGGVIRVSMASVVGALPNPALGPSQTRRATINHTLAIVRFNYANDTSESISDAALEQTLFGTGRTVRDFYSRASSGGLSLSGLVLPYVTLDTNRDAVCRTSSDAAAARIKVQQDLGWDLADFDHVLFMFNGSPACETRAFAEVAGQSSYYPNYGANGPPAQVIEHELGHNLGLNHANVAMCKTRGVPVAIGSGARCDNFEYADRSDVMGVDERQFHGPHQARLGFLSLDNAQDVVPAAPATATAVTVNDDEQVAAPGVKQLLRIRRSVVADPNDPYAYLYVDYRKPDGIYDTYPANAPIVKGVTVRFGPSYGTPNGEIRAAMGAPGRNATINDSYKLGNARAAITDPSGRTAAASQQDFALTPGQSMWDPKQDITITAVTAGTGQASIKVTTGGPPGNATSVGVVGSALQVNAGAGRRNDVILTENDGEIIVADNGNSVTATAGCVQIDRQTVRCSKTPIASAKIMLGDGNDVGAVYGDDLKIPVTFDGGDGQDSLEGGLGDDTFLGGPGGSTGNDSDLITGGGGKDTVSYANRTAGVTITSANAAFGDASAAEGDQVDPLIGGLIGGSGNDGLRPDASVAQRLDGGGGTDLFVGGNLDDTIIARDGVTEGSITCGGGNDTLIGDAADTSIDGCENKPLTPNVQITSGPAEGSTTNALKPAFAFSAGYAPGIVYGCKLESGTAPGTAPLTACNAGTFTPAADASTGPVVFSVTGTVAGQTATIVRKFTVDRTAPETTFTAKPAAIADPGAVAFTITSDGGPGTRFECSIDGSAYTSCPAQKRYPDSAPGSHTVTARAIDAAGNADATPASWTWKTTYAATINDDDVHFDGGTATIGFHTNSSNATTVCQIDTEFYSDAPFEPCTSPFVRSGLAADTQYFFYVKALDPAGVLNQQDAEYYSWVQYADELVDTGITAGPENGGTTSDSRPVFEFNGRSTSGPTDALRFDCKVNSGTFVPCTSPYTLPTALPLGQATFAVRTYVYDGQRLSEDRTPATSTFSVVHDTAFTDALANGSQTRSPTPTFTFASTPATGATFECSIGNLQSAWSPCTSPWTVPAQPEKGVLFRVRAKGIASGLYDPTPAYKIVDFDYTAPDTSITSGPAAGSTITTASPQFGFTSPDSSATFQCQLDGGPWGACTSPTSLTGLLNGSHTFGVRGRDAALNIDATPATRTFTVSQPKVLTTTTAAPAVPVPLTSDGTLGGARDWIHWKGTTAAEFDRKAGTPLISTWTKLLDKPVFSWSGASTYSWTDAAGSTPSGSSAVGVGTGQANGRGFKITVPATSAATRTLKLWVGVKGVATTAALNVFFGDGVKVNQTLSSTSDTAIVARVYTIEYRPSNANDTLSIDWYQGGGSTNAGSQAILYAAAVY